eukprot:8907846-Heterocapsa_arctica.AAC.1
MEQLQGRTVNEKASSSHENPNRIIPMDNIADDNGSLARSSNHGPLARISNHFPTDYPGAAKVIPRCSLARSSNPSPLAR